MRIASIHLLAGLIVLSVHGALPAQQPPSYARQIKPFFARYCLECHSADKMKGGLNLETYQTLRAGGDNGPVLVPDKPNDSRLLMLLEGKAKPKMPPRKAKQPKPDEIALVRAWIAAGAHDDVAKLTVSIPDIKPRVPTVASVAALAYRPDGKLLAVGRHKEVLLLDPTSGEVIARLVPPGSKVTALAFSPEGRRLAVASGEPVRFGAVQLYTSTSATTWAGVQVQTIPQAHQDLIQAIAFRFDGKVLATCGYDRLVKLWDIETTPRELHVLKDHSDAVYGVAFSPDGKLLASAAADRAVKVWDVATGKRLYTLGEATDWLYAVAWSPDGRHLAAAGVDKSIRVWEVSAAEGKLVQSVFAHEEPVTRLVYAADGRTLYSVSENHVVKAWDTSRMEERKVYARQPEAVLALAVRPDHKQLALGRYDGAVILLDEATGKVQSQPVPVKPKPPETVKLTPAWGPRGRAVRVVFEGKHLDGVTEVVATYPGVSARLVPDGRTATSLAAEVMFSAQTPAGVYPLTLKSAAGASKTLPFTVDLFPAVPEQEPNDSAGTGQKVTLPVTITGTIGRAGDIDYFRFEATAGQQVGVQVLTAAVGSKLEPVLELTDTRGNVLAASTSGVLGYTCPKAGIYALAVRDRDYRGDPGRGYRLHIGEVPVVTAVHPLGLQRGTEAEIHLDGVNLGPTRSIHVKAPADAAPGTSVPLSVQTPWGAPLGKTSVVVGEFPEVVAPNTVVPVPGTANGLIDRPGETNTWRFPAKKGQRLILETNARRLGSPLDSYIEILDARGQPLPRAVLRCLAKTDMIFRDHDSGSPGIRIETWSQLAVNDYLWVGNELIRIHELPKNPDDDCHFFSNGGQRVGYLGTTPTYHPIGTPMYKVAIHPPGTTFPPNGFPIITVYYRNDDGGPGYGKDSLLFFDPPADGEYQVRVGDSRGQGGPEYAYRLTIRPPRPSFNVSFSPTSPAVWKGGAVPVSVSADRIDGYDGPIDVRLENLPPGFSGPATSIPAEENSTAFALWADATAQTPVNAPALKLVARAKIDGHEVVREVTGGLPKVVDPGDLVTTTGQSEVTVRPGQHVWLTVAIERRNGFKGRVPIEVRGLPHGVRVLDIGLNGILITERDTSRRIEIYCEPWMQPTTHPFVILAKREGKNAEHAARSVLLKVVR
jgi:DNA-binding beta-propeller fold protein YncE